MYLHRAVASSFFLFCPKSAAFTNFRQTHHCSKLKRPYHNFRMTSSSDADSSSGKVIVVGSINQDLTTYSRTLPAPGETLLGEDFVTSPGGKGGNQAVAAASIGIVCMKSGVHMVGRVGDDDMGRSLMNGLKSRGVSGEYTIPVTNHHTGVASINVCDSGQNTIIVAPGANLALNAQEVDSALSKLLQNGGGQQNVVLVQLEIKPATALCALQAATAEGAITILNPAPAPKGWKMTDDWYSNIDILIPNESELASLCGMSEEDVTGEGEEAMAKALLEKGVRHAVIVTLGERGAMIVRRRQGGGKQPATEPNYDSILTSMISEPSDLPCKTLPVVDAVGAGDAFCGALSAYLSRGVDLERACSMACGYASMSVRKRGAQESYPLARDLPECLRLDDSKQESDANDGSRGTITFVTGNKNKLLEVQRLLSSDRTQSMPFDLDNAKLDLPELQGSPEQIAREKCETAANRLQSAVMTEDTSLCFHALKGLPGPYIKWFLDDLGHDGLNKLLQGFDDNRAYAQTIIAFSPGAGKEVNLFDGRTEGRIVPPRGALDFGWDPVFEPLPDECHSGGIASGNTYAEMTKDEKNKISHRSRAFQKFREFLASSADEVLKDMQC